MARPKQQVDEENKNEIYRYFSTFFSEDRYIYRNRRSHRNKESIHLFKDGRGNLIEVPFKSREAFNLIDAYHIDVVKLQQWIDSYTSEYLWKMCLNSLYQKKFTNNSKMMHTVKITQSAREMLTICKRKTDMSMDEMLEKAIDLLYAELINKE